MKKFALILVTGLFALSAVGCESWGSNNNNKNCCKKNCSSCSKGRRCNSNCCQGSN